MLNISGWKDSFNPNEYESVVIIMIITCFLFFVKRGKSPRRRRIAAAVTELPNRLDDLVAGTIVTLINPRLGWQKEPETITAYYSGIDTKDGKHFFTIKDENDEFIPGEKYNSEFHINHDGEYRIEPKQSDNIEEILLKNKEKLNRDPPVFDFSSFAGMLKKTEIGVFTGIIMCVGVVIHNKRNGDSLAFHYVVPDVKNQDNRQKAFDTIKEAMKSFKWEANDCQLHLFMKDNEATKDAVNEARIDISGNFREYKPFIHILYNRPITFQHDDNTELLKLKIL